MSELEKIFQDWLLYGSAICILDGKGNIKHIDITKVTIEGIHSEQSEE